MWKATAWYMPVSWSHTTREDAAFSRKRTPMKMRKEVNLPTEGL